MTIDPTLYRKVSGKGGDAEKKLGDSLARLGHRPRRVQQESGPPEWVSAIGTMVMSRWMMSILLSVFVLIAIPGLMWTPADWTRMWWKITGGGPQKQQQMPPTTQTP